MVSNCVAILVTALTGQAKCSSDPSRLISSQVDLALLCPNTSSIAFPKESKAGSNLASLKIAGISCVKAQLKGESTAESNYSR